LCEIKKELGNKRMDMNEIRFSAEVIKVEVKKTLSSDREFKVIMVTDDPKALELSAFVNEQAVKITVSGDLSTVSP
jgi:hypothetical protein